jgi:hypothetical protein
MRREPLIVISRLTTRRAAAAAGDVIVPALLQARPKRGTPQSLQT